jgi:hypothetical protein
LRAIDWGGLPAFTGACRGRLGIAKYRRDHDCLYGDGKCPSHRQCPRTMRSEHELIERGSNHPLSFGTAICVRMKTENLEERLQNEIEHGRYLVKHGPGEVWNWDRPAGGAAGAESEYAGGRLAPGDAGPRTRLRFRVFYAGTR